MGLPSYCCPLTPMTTLAMCRRQAVRCRVARSRRLSLGPGDQHHMDIKSLKELTKLMRDNDLVEIEVESPDLKVKLKKASGAVATVTHLAAAPVLAPAAAPAAAAAPVVDE